MEGIEKKLDTMLAEKLDGKMKEVDETLKVVDEKLAAIKKFNDATNDQGRALASPPEPSEDEKRDAAAKKLLEGTGLSY
jgi:hypothetical protein